MVEHRRHVTNDLERHREVVVPEPGKLMVERTLGGLQPVPPPIKSLEGLCPRQISIGLVIGVLPVGPRRRFLRNTSAGGVDEQIDRALNAERLEFVEFTGDQSPGGPPSQERNGFSSGVELDHTRTIGGRCEDCMTPRLETFEGLTQVIE